MQPVTGRAINLPYQLFTLVLCVLVIGMLLFDTTVDTNSEVKQLLMWSDYCLCLLFFLDFIYVLVTSENKKKYLMTWGWIDLLSCIPTFGWGRIARLIRILKLLKTLRTGQNLIKAISQRRGESALLSATIVLIFAMLFGSVAILQCEMDEVDGNIHNASDAVWWTFCTIMKGGAENYDPVSIEGRLVAVVLMFVGMVFGATIIGFMAMLLTSSGKKEEDESSDN
jgi:voltage-gated potassium channel